ncbi:hypothetical protein [Deinococcus soli (ex Cha et al. 2016)]|uniref:Uncharacterized protein n=2 Tax=Deinococcus soli (ex Cha et al. 2016) TaxID=1309411 RepID=A0ACC6KHI1_9DEIO|nr:hypothetical protein [Deinococcus soli (ex Cha et al. 2016)]MDR6218855.1 hypothetical protein [Deinococcus soli (ex Cha et al. 2016)]MDR6328652.1 hypothetical protein [Deinococcus soli (ex Cha et al. 2016)]MDR6751861.1 hypothetical protein [Deinococcus soli (ex Cha et al. 2016)]
MQNRDLTAQARRLATLLDEEFGVKAGHARIMQLLARSLGYASHQALRADTQGEPPAQPAPTIWTRPMTQDELQAGLNPQGLITGTVAVTQAELIGRDLRDVHATLSQKLTGTVLLGDVTFEVTGMTGRDLLVQVTGQGRLAAQTGGFLPVVDCEVRGAGGRRVGFDSARYFLSLSDRELMAYACGLRGSGEGATPVAEDTRAWDPKVDRLIEMSPEGYTCTYDREQVVLLALVARPHLREQLVGRADWPDARRLARWNLPSEEDLYLPALRHAMREAQLTDQSVHAAAHAANMNLDSSLSGDALLRALLEEADLELARDLLEYAAKYHAPT